jgi:virginiamycin B lyase
LLQTRFLAVVTTASLLLSGCAIPSERSSGPAFLPSAKLAAAPVASPSVKHHGHAQVTFKIHWKHRRQGRRPHYIPATARSISISINGGVPQYANSPLSALVVSAPGGTDTFAIATYDEQNGQGNILSIAFVSQNIIPGHANTIAATLNGVIASTTISLSNPAPNVGEPATVNINATAFDADHNVIVGAGDYDTPILLSISDPASSGTLSLSTATLQNPSATATLVYNGGTLSIASIIGRATGIASVAATFAPSPTFYQFSIPTASNRPQFIARGSDGNMWFTESAPGNKVARITPAGVVTEFSPPTANSNPGQIIGASDGNLWFTEISTNKIAKLTTTGTFTEFSTLFAPPPNDNPFGLVDRGDGNIWYVANGSSRIGFQGISSGVAGETSIPTANSGPFGIATAPDLNLYYTESGVDKIGRITNLFTAQSEISLTSGTVPEQIVRGPDGNLWFAENGTSKIGRLSPNSFFVSGEFPTLTPNAAPTGMVVGLDGAIWFTENGLDRIGRITTGGTVSEFASPVTGLGLRGIAVAPDGSLWFCEPGTGLNPGRIGKLVY